MMEQTSKQSRGSLTTATKITAIFTALGLMLAYGVGSVTDSQVIQFGLLFVVGAIVPALINESRR